MDKGSKTPTALWVQGVRMHVAITGGTGLMGSHLTQGLRERGDEVTIVSRSPGGEDTVTWDPKTPGSLTLPASITHVVHLAGAPMIGERWTDDYKQEIRESRVMGTRTVVDAVEDHDDIQHVVSASAVGYYGDRGDEVLTEDATPGDDFLAGVVKDWELEARKLDNHDAVANDPALLRSGVVLHPEDGALAQMLNPILFVKPFHWGIGGRVGDGQQFFPWVHIDDQTGAMLHLLDEELSGPFNTPSPGVVRNETFTQALGEALDRPTKIPVPKLALKILYGEAATVMFDSQHVVPERLKKTGFSYRYENVQDALDDLLAG